MIFLFNFFTHHYISLFFFSSISNFFNIFSTFSYLITPHRESIEEENNNFPQDTTGPEIFYSGSTQAYQRNQLDPGSLEILEKLIFVNKGRPIALSCGKDILFNDKKIIFIILCCYLFLYCFLTFYFILFFDQWVNIKIKSYISSIFSSWLYHF